MKSIQVNAEHVYQVFVGRDILAEVANHIDGATRVAVIHPLSMQAAAGQLRQSLSNVESISIEVPDAENAKTAAVLE